MNFHDFNGQAIAADLNVETCDLSIRRYNTELTMIKTVLLIDKYLKKELAAACEFLLPDTNHGVVPPGESPYAIVKPVPDPNSQKLEAQKLLNKLKGLQN